MKFFLSFNVYAYINILFISFMPVLAQQNTNLEKKTIDEVSLHSSLLKFVELFPNRITGSERLSAASDFVATELGEYGYSCDKQVWREKIGTETRFAINTYCISDLGLIEPSILLIAHLDIVPTTIQGAGDNGSGVSILLALAKNVAKTPASRKMIFLFSDAEEYGMVGSKKFFSEISGPFNIRHVIAVDHVASKRSDCFDIALEGQYKFIASADLYRLFHLAAQKKNICLEHAPLIKQLLARMVPISSLDSGPFIANGIQGIGLKQSWKADKEGIWTEYHSQDDSMDNISSSRLFLAYSLVRETIDLLISGQNKNDSVSLIAYFNERNALISHSVVVIIFSILLLLILLLSLPKFIKLIKKMEVSRILFGIRIIAYYIIAVCLFSILIKLLTYFEIIKYYPEYPGTPKDSYLINDHIFSVLIFYLSPVIFLYLIFSKNIISRIDFDFLLCLISILFILILSIFLFRNHETIIFFLPGLSINLLRINSNSRITNSIKIIFILIFSYSIISYFLFVFGFNILHINYSIIWYSLLMMSGNMTSFGVLLPIIFGLYLPVFSIIGFLTCNSIQKG